MRAVLTSLLLMLLLMAAAMHADESFQIAFETTDCNGDTGFATVDSDKVAKVVNADCRVDGEKLKMMLVKKAGSYVTYKLTAQEAQAVMADIKARMRTKTQMLQNASKVIVTQ